MLNRRDRNLAGYAQTKAICSALFDVCKRAFLKIGACWSRFGTKSPHKV